MLIAGVLISVYYMYMYMSNIAVELVLVGWIGRRVGSCGALVVTSGQQFILSEGSQVRGAQTWVQQCTFSWSVQGSCYLEQLTKLHRLQFVVQLSRLCCC
jgi:hypothetical protein